MAIEKDPNLSEEEKREKVKKIKALEEKANDEAVDDDEKENENEIPKATKTKISFNGFLIDISYEDFADEKTRTVWKIGNEPYEKLELDCDCDLIEEKKCKYQEK